jgi:hypothetical protein
VRDVLTPVAAFELEAEIVAKRAGQLSTWVPLAGALYRFHSGEGWRQRACESFNEWLAQPEVNLGRAEAYALIAAWRELVVEREVAVGDIAELDPSKVQVVLPAIRGGVEVQDALSDCASLSRSDLREKYQQDGQVEYATCPQCGGRYRVAA